MTVAAATLVVAGCNSAGGGDVVAKVGAEKVTKAQLDAELALSGAANPGDPALRKAMLDQIVARKLLAQEARAEKLDKSPEAAALRVAAIETYEANLERSAMMSTIPKPTEADATTFIQAHPEMFGERTGYVIERLNVVTKADPALVKALEPAKTLEAVEAVLTQRGIAYSRSVSQIDTLQAAPQLTATLRRLQPGEPFVVPEPNGFTVGRVRDSKVQPLVGPAAIRVASEIVYGQRQTTKMKERLDALKSKKVTYAGAGAADADKPGAAPEKK
ncbi:peptidyl-prolyl cis-trans isomerase [Phenylobacterium sp.]|uniref:peptidyl-prolyl cis-trans isomerase n=1 Tax=Phenylobacterium sp. TaxID=1871053 RepID=UPI0025E1E3C2|nr:peptidyl-prolyl cis-trans isomerase [Phenylobacterium sp.]MBX3485575.1 SurA N-terminal domain-containing protein [Phenylobacterium sp.]